MDTTTAALYAAITGLAGCVGYLWRWIALRFEEMAAQLQECEKDRLRIWKHLAGHPVDENKDATTFHGKN